MEQKEEVSTGKRIILQSTVRTYVNEKHEGHQFLEQKFGKAVGTGNGGMEMG